MLKHVFFQLKTCRRIAPRALLEYRLVTQPNREINKSPINPPIESLPEFDDLQMIGELLAPAGEA